MTAIKIIINNVNNYLKLSKNLMKIFHFIRKRLCINLRLPTIFSINKNTKRIRLKTDIYS